MVLIGESRSAAQWAALTQRRPLQRTMARPGCTAVTLVDVTQRCEGLNEAERDPLSSQGALVCDPTADEGLDSLLICDDGDIVIVGGQTMKTFQTAAFLTVSEVLHRQTAAGLHLFCCAVSKSDHVLATYTKVTAAQRSA